MQHSKRQNGREKGTNGARKVRDERKRWKEKHRKEIVFHSIWTGCVLRGPVLHSPHFSLLLILPLSPSLLLTHTLSVALFCHFSPFLASISCCTFSLWTLYLIFISTFISISSCTIFFSVVSLGSSPCVCHYKCPFTSLCLWPLQVTSPQATHTASVGVTGSCRARSGRHCSPGLWLTEVSLWQLEFSPVHLQKEILQLGLCIYKADDCSDSMNLLFKYGI